MYRIFFLTCVIIGSLAEESDSREEKYIDLLPENEKKEFLDKIARRIFEEVQSKADKDATSGEISDVKLEAQNEYVKKLLEEETKNLRRTKVNDSHSSDISKEKEINLGAYVDDKIDLTLREGKRNKRNKSRESSSETEENSAPVKQDNKSSENISVEIAVKDKKTKTLNEEDKLTTIKSESGEKIPVKVVYDELDTTSVIKESTKPTSRTKKYASTENEGSVTEITNFSAEESKSVDSVDSSANVESKKGNKSLTLDNTPQSITEDDNKSDVKLDQKQGMAERIYESVKQNSEDVSSDNEKKPDPVDNNTTSSKESSSDVETQEVSTATTEANLNQDEKKITTEYNKDEVSNSTQLDQPKIITSQLRTDVKDNENHSEDENSQTSRNDGVLTTTFSDVSKSLETSSNNPAKNTESPSETKVFSTSEETNDKEKNESNQNGLRHGFFETSAETQIEDTKLFHEIKSGYIGDHVSHYEVYEVRPDKLPFVEQPRKIKPLATEQPYQREEHPYYVPVYNYAPNNAYFNPYNRLGPNFDDKETDEDFVEPDIARERLVKPSGQALNEIENFFKPAKINRPVYTNYNLQDYFDMAYYFGRSGDSKRKQHRIRNDKEEIFVDKTRKEKSFLPNSDESDHPSNNIHLKDHMSSIRQILYANKVFGHVPGHTAPPSTTSLLTTLPESSTTMSPTTESERFYFLRSKGYSSELSKEYHKQKLKRPYKYKNKAPISADYYFGVSDAQRNRIGQIFRAHNEENNETDTTEKPKLYSDADIRNILDMTHPADLLPTLGTLMYINYKDQYAARNRDDLDSYLTVLKDMINSDSRALSQYDWLRTAVDIRSALKKLTDLSQQIKSSEVMHPADSELLRYVMYLYKSTKKVLSIDNAGNIDEKETLIPAVIFDRGMFLKNKKPHSKLIKTKGLMHRVWLRMIKGDAEFRKDLRNFDDFLNDMEFGLYNLHDAIKHIAMITRYNKERWFENLKDLYLANTTKRELLELLLHFFTSRLIDLLEETSTKGVEDGYLDYIAKNKDDVRKTHEKFLFTLRILEKMKYYY